MISEKSFADKVIKSFKNITKEIEKGSSEHDVRYRFVKYFVEDVLGYEPKYIKWEKKRADLTIIDENNFAVIKIETKRPTENINKPQYEEQAFKYEEEATRYIGLTNFLQLKLWEVKRKEHILQVNLDFSSLIEKKKTSKDLSSDEQSQILFLHNLSKQVLFDPSKYERFDETYARIDITHDAGFKKLLDRLNYIANTLLYGYTLKSFGEYKEGYGKYLEELHKAEREMKNNGNNQELNHSFAKYKQKLEEKYAKYKTFSGYDLWKEYSGKENVSDDEVKEIFCKETIYVFLNKLLFLRICEDKGLLEKNISNGGIEELQTVLKKRFKKDTLNKEILNIAFGSAKELYSHFYETGILDWFRTGDGEFNELLNRILWIFNQFDFAHVDRDILGNLYEKYLPGRERKRLGEFYTPVEVIDYILTSVGYTYSHDIETKDILDPACGSGGFLVRASRRLISRYLMKFGKTDKTELRDPKNWREIVDKLSPDEAQIILESIREHIFGLDINPFACHIAEMNLLIQTIDLFQKVKQKNPEYKLERFKIYRTDSLESVSQRHLWDYTYAAFLEEQEEIDAIKQKKFDFVVGNPPYVRVQFLEDNTKKYLSDTYSSATGLFDLYVIFIERGFNWLVKKGNFGYIISNKFIQSAYGKGIREYIINNCKISTIIDFGDSGVFKDVTNYPLIFIGEKSTTNKNMFKFIRVLSPKDNILEEIWGKYKNDFFKNNFLEIFDFDQSRLSKEMWSFSNPRYLEIVNKIKSVSKGFFISNFARPHRCLYTGLNEAYIVNEKTIKDEKLESALLKKVIGGKDIERWNINWKNKYIIYPYTISNGRFHVVTLDDYPNTKRHLEKNKDKLMKRWFIKKVKKQDRERRWFEYADPRNFQQFENVKIITPDISTKNRFSLDYEKFFSLNTSYVIDLDNFDNKPEYLLGLLNSSTLEFYFKQISPFISGGYFRYINQYLEKIPIKLPNNHKEQQLTNKIIENVNEVLNLKKSILIDLEELISEEETEKLCNLPKVTFSVKEKGKIENIKLDNYKIFVNNEDHIEIKDTYLLEYVKVYLKYYLDDLNKIDNVKSFLINIPVPKSPGILNEIINKGDFDLIKIDEQVKKLEQEINKLVYDLYGLNKEEITIIERSLTE